MRVCTRLSFTLVDCLCMPPHGVPRKDRAENRGANHLGERRVVPCPSVVKFRSRFFPREEIRTNPWNERIPTLLPRSLGRSFACPAPPSLLPTTNAAVCLIRLPTTTMMTTTTATREQSRRIREPLQQPVPAAAQPQNQCRHSSWQAE